MSGLVGRAQLSPEVLDHPFDDDWNLMIKSARRPASVLLVVLLSAGTFVACGSDSDKPESVDPAAHENLKELGGEQLVKAANAEGALTLYTALNTDQSAAMVKAFEKEFPAIAVETVENTGGPLQEIIKTENRAGKLRADVIEQSDPALMNELDKTESLIGDYQPPSSAAYPPDLVLNGKIYPGYVQLTGLAYNTALVSDPPTSWQDFLLPAFADRRTTAAPSAGGCAWTLAMFERSVLGLEYWEDLADVGVKITNSNTEMIQAVGQGENLITTMLDPVARGAIKQGAPAKMVYPAEGVAPCQYGVGTVKDSPHPNAAKLWLNWLLSESGQSVWVDELEGYSAREGMDRPAGLPDDVSIWKVPVKDYLALHDEWIADWNRIFDYTPE